MPSLLSACIKYLLVLYGHGDNFLLLSQYLPLQVFGYDFHVSCLLFTVYWFGEHPWETHRIYLRLASCEGTGMATSVFALFSVVIFTFQLGGRIYL